MYDIDIDLWEKMCRETIDKRYKHLESFDFWVEVQTLYSKNGDVFSQVFPRLSINFK